MLSCLMSLTAYQVTAGLAGRSPAPGDRRLAIGGIGPGVGGIGPGVGGSLGRDVTREVLNTALASLGRRGLGGG
jgi:hypothetical protein